MNRKKSTTILGAGPAGLSAAITLAKRGVSVKVIERRHDCGARFRGDLQGIENFSTGLDFRDELDAIGISSDFSMVPFRHVIGIDPDAREYEVASESPFYYLVRRGPMSDSLDSGLKRQALSLGVRIHCGRRTGDEENVDIVATGAPPNKLRALCYGRSFETDHPDAAWVMLDNEVAYRGYAYLLVANGYGCLCTGVFGRFHHTRRQFEQTEKRFAEVAQLTMRNPSPVAGIGTFRCPPVFSRDGRLFAGEAAGLQDPLFGFGIRYAIQSGTLAARGILGEIDYEKEAHLNFSPRIRTGVINRFLWERFGHTGYRRFLKRATRSDGRQFFNRLSRPGIFHTLGFAIAKRFLGRPPIR